MSMNDNGMLIRRVGEMYLPYDVKRLSELTNINSDTIMVAIQLLQKVGLLEILDNGAFYLNQVKNMVGSETERRKKMRKHRNKTKALQCNETETQVKQLCNKNVAKNETPESRYKRIENREKIVEEIKEENSTATTESKSDFSEIHKLYAGEISRNGLCCSPLETEKIKNLLAEYGAGENEKGDRNCRDEK